MRIAILLMAVAAFGQTKIQVDTDKLASTACTACVLATACEVGEFYMAGDGGMYVCVKSVTFAAVSQSKYCFEAKGHQICADWPTLPIPKELRQ